jgi:hypothetical protein
MTEGGAGGRAPLHDALSRARDAVAHTSLPLALPSAAVAARTAASLLSQLDDYLLPRLGTLDAPTLAVVGGSTGAGKSTLVNSLVRAPVSPAGALRPTTRAPVLVCHPMDAPWFAAPNLLPAMSRSHADARVNGGTDSTVTGGSNPTVTGSHAVGAHVAPSHAAGAHAAGAHAAGAHAAHAAGAHPAGEAPGPAGGPMLQVVMAPALNPGLALLDAPDIDSVVAENRRLAEELLAAADMWLFVTTAARYADAVPWQTLRQACERGVPVAVVLDRVTVEQASEVALDLAKMLAGRDLGDAPLFIIPESTLDGQGMLVEQRIAPVRTWLDSLARDPVRRAAVTRRTIAGAVRSVGARLNELEVACDEQTAAAEDLAGMVRSAYSRADAVAQDAVTNGTLLGGDVSLAWWEELAPYTVGRRGTHERKGPQASSVANRITRAVAGREIQDALLNAVAVLITESAADADRRTQVAWAEHPAGRVLWQEAAVGRRETASCRPDLVRRAVRGWQSAVRSMVRAARVGAPATPTSAGPARPGGPGGPTGTRPGGAPPAGTSMQIISAGDVDAVCALVTLATFAPRQGTTPILDPASRSALRAVLADEQVRRIAARARTDLRARIRDFLAEERHGYLVLLQKKATDPAAAARLRAVATEVRRVAESGVGG